MKENTTPWAVARVLPGCDRPHIVGRFTRRIDAEGHLQFLGRFARPARFTLVFDP